jgi:hypothetical protein
MGGHDEMRQQGLGSRVRMFDEAALQFRQLPLDSVWSDIAEKVQLSPPRGFRATIGQVDDHALLDSIDSGVRLVDEAAQTFG